MLYPLAPRGTWAGMCNFEENGYVLVLLRPSAFLSLTPDIKMNAEDEETVDWMKLRIARRLPLDPLELHVGAHDGRHRAIASLEMGVEFVPVLVREGYPLP